MSNHYLQGRPFEVPGTGVVMDKAVLFRRCVHCLLALAPCYFLLPAELPWLGTGRWVLLIGFFLVVVVVESVRHMMGWNFFGLRPHERHHIASFVWAAAGVTIALWFFRDDVATAAIIGMALVDPLAGELRRLRPGSPITIALPVAAYAGIAAMALYSYGMMTDLGVVSVSIIGAAAAVGVEREKIRYIDDDFIMIVLPCLLMELFAF